MSTANYTIRLAQGEDFSLIQQMAREIWYDCYTEIISERQIEYMLQTMYSEPSIKFYMQREYRTYLVYFEEEPIAYYSIELRRPNKLLYLHRNYLRKDYQGQGVGDFLLNTIEQLAQQNRLTTIQLNVNRNNNRALAFYKKNHFQIISEIDSSIGSGFYMNAGIPGTRLNDL